MHNSTNFLSFNVACICTGVRDIDAMHRHMDAHPVARLHEYERAGQRDSPVSARMLGRGVSCSGGSRLLLHRAWSSRSTIPGKYNIQSRYRIQYDLYNSR